MSQSRLGKPKSEETKIRMSLSSTGKRHSVETKEKIKETKRKNRLLKNGGVKNDTSLSVESKAEPLHRSDSKHDADSYAKFSDPQFGKAKPSQPSRFDPSYNPEPPNASLGGSDHPGGKSLAGEGGFSKGRDRLDAGNAEFRTTGGSQ
jgi:hypothetical protein